MVHRSLISGLFLPSYALVHMVFGNLNLLKSQSLPRIFRGRVCNVLKTQDVNAGRDLTCYTGS